MRKARRVAVGRLAFSFGLLHAFLAQSAMVARLASDSSPFGFACSVCAAEDGTFCGGVEFRFFCVSLFRGGCVFAFLSSFSECSERSAIEEEEAVRGVCISCALSVSVRPRKGCRCLLRLRKGLCRRCGQHIGHTPILLSLPCPLEIC